MKIVIDIPDRVYSYIKKEWADISPEFDSPINHVMQGIKNGTLLPDTVDHYNAVVYMQGVSDGLNADKLRGKWISEYVEEMGMKTLVCSKCHYPMGQVRDCFCANCGADMKGEEV